MNCIIFSHKVSLFIAECGCLLSNRSQRTSKCGKNISDTLGCTSCATFLFLPDFDVICDLLLNRCTATWDLFVKYTVHYVIGMYFLQVYACILLQYIAINIAKCMYCTLEKVKLIPKIYLTLKFEFEQLEQFTPHQVNYIFLITRAGACNTYIFQLQWESF